MTFLHYSPPLAFSKFACTPWSPKPRRATLHFTAKAPKLDVQTYPAVALEKFHPCLSRQRSRTFTSAFVPRGSAHKILSGLSPCPLSRGSARESFPFPHFPPAVALAHFCPFDCFASNTQTPEDKDSCPTCCFTCEVKRTYSSVQIRGVYKYKMFVTPPPSLLDLRSQLMDSQTFSSVKVLQATA